METIPLTPWQRGAIEVGLRKLAASGEANRDSLHLLQQIIDASTQIRVTYEPS